MVDLIACYWTLAGPYSWEGDTSSPWDLRDRAQAASRAGFRGIGIAHVDLRRAVAQYGFESVRLILEDNGLTFLELEALTDWFTVDSSRTASDGVRLDLLEAAEKLGAARLKSGGALKPDISVSVEQMTNEFAILARQAHDAGTMVTLEPIAFSNIPDLRTGLAVIGDTVGRGGGLMLDSWHATRGNYSLDAIAHMAPGVVAGVEINDGSLLARGDPLQETLNERMLCGEGEFDLKGLIASCRAAGYDGPWGVEVLSAAQRARNLEAAAQESFDAAIRQFGMLEPRDSNGVSASSD